MPEPGLPPPDECANCGAEIPRQAKACPGCGADERTGWRENADTLYDGLDLPDSAFADEPDAAAPRRARSRAGLPWYWVAVGITLIALLALGLVSFR